MNTPDPKETIRRFNAWMGDNQVPDGKAADLLGVSRIHLLQILAGNRVPTQGECERMTSVMQNNKPVGP